MKHAQEQREDIPEDLAFAQEKIYKKKPAKIEEDYFPIDTILETTSIPNWSIVQRLKFSSFEKLREQLDKWNFPYQVVHFSKGREVLKSLKESPEPQAQIRITAQYREYEPKEFFIVKRASDGEYFDPERQNEEFTFSGTLGVVDNGDIIFNQSINDSQFASKVKTEPPKEKEVILASKAIVRIDCPKNSLPSNSIEIEGKKIPLTPDQKTKIGVAQYTSNFDEERGNLSGTIISRWIEIHFEFPIDNPEEPILKDVRVVGYRDVYK